MSAKRAMQALHGAQTAGTARGSQHEYTMSVSACASLSATPHGPRRPLREILRRGSYPNVQRILYAKCNVAPIFLPFPLRRHSQRLFLRVMILGYLLFFLGFL